MITLDTFLEDFGSTIGLDAFAVDAEGQAQFDVGSVLVDLSADRSTGRLLLSCLIGELPDHDRENVMAGLLDANSMLAGTRGATLGVPAGSGAVILARGFAFRHETGETFAEALLDFVAAAENLRGLLLLVREAESLPSGTDAMIRI